MDFLTMSISSSGSWTSVERIMSGTRHPIRFVIEAKFLWFEQQEVAYNGNGSAGLVPALFFLSAAKWYYEQ